MTKYTLKNISGKNAPTCSHHGTQILVGEGEENYPFPTAADLVKEALKNAQLAETKKKKTRKTKKSRAKKQTKVVLAKLMKQPVDLRETLGIKPKAIIPDTDSTIGHTLVEGADGIQELMMARQFDGIIESRFGNIYGAVHWAKHHMPDKYHEAAVSLFTQLKALKERYAEALPMVMQQLIKQNPEVPVPTLLQHAVKLLDQQLAQILFILNVYADSFGQYRDERFSAELDAVSFFYEQAFLLFQKLNPNDVAEEEDITKVEPQIDLSTFHVGDVFLARFTGMGLSTIPGSKGPIGAHALQVPYDMHDVLTIMLPLFAHEFRHNIFYDIPGMAEELTEALKQAILDAVESGEIKLVNDTVKLGESELPAGELLAKMVVDSIGEIDADISGGVMLNGPAFLYAMVMSFPAMMIRGSKVSEATKLLRTSSVYELEEQEDGSKALRFEPHPPDYIRTHIVGAALRHIGFPEEADQLRELSDIAVGEVPEFITWTDAEEQVDMTISIPVADIQAAAPVIAKTLISHKLKSLGDRATEDFVNWTPRREEKVQALADQLVAGKADIPEDVGSVYATYIGAAAIVAYWKKVAKGGDPVESAKQVNKTALSMMKTLRAKFEG